MLFSCRERTADKAEKPFRTGSSGPIHLRAVKKHKAAGKRFGGIEWIIS